MRDRRRFSFGSGRIRLEPAAGAARLMRGRRRFSFGSGRIRLEPAAGAARLMGKPAAGAARLMGKPAAVAARLMGDGSYSSLAPPSVIEILYLLCKCAWATLAWLSFG